MGIEFKGYSGWKQLREYLERKSFFVKQIKKRNLLFKKNYFYILRIQWIGEEENKEKPFYGWKGWFQASANTHFIIIHNDMFFCNEEEQWLPVKSNKYSLKGYLEHYQGVITSAMEIVQR